MTVRVRVMGLKLMVRSFGWGWGFTVVHSSGMTSILRQSHCRRRHKDHSLPSLRLGGRSVLWFARVRETCQCLEGHPLRNRRPLRPGSRW